MKILKLSSLVAVVSMAFSVMTAAAQPPQGGQGGREQMSPDEMAKMQVERMAKELKLDKEQQKKIYDITLKSLEERMTSQKGGERPSREQMMKAQEDLSKRIKPILNKEQAKKYDEMMEQMQKRQSQGQGQGGPQGGR